MPSRPRRGCASRSISARRRPEAAEKVAHHAERLGGYLSDSSADRILADLEDFGRRQPMAVVGVGFVAGFMASRFLKASSRERYQGRATSEPAMPVSPPPVGEYGA